jgi:hypothetical protein
VNWTGKLGLQNVVNRPLARHARHPLESVRDEHHPKMGFAAGPRAGVAFVQMGFVPDFDQIGGEGLNEF